MEPNDHGVDSREVSFLLNGATECVNDFETLNVIN